MDWRDRAACVRVDPELFFPVRTVAFADQTRRAQAVCARCEVIGQCRAWALSTGEDAGVWGGLTEDERRRMRRRRARTAHGGHCRSER